MNQIYGGLVLLGAVLTAATYLFFGNTSQKQRPPTKNNSGNELKKPKENKNPVKTQEVKKKPPAKSSKSATSSVTPPPKRIKTEDRTQNTSERNLQRSPKKNKNIPEKKTKVETSKDTVKSEKEKSNKPAEKPLKVTEVSSQEVLKSPKKAKPVTNAGKENKQESELKPAEKPIKVTEVSSKEILKSPKKAKPVTSQGKENKQESESKPKEKVNSPKKNSKNNLKQSEVQQNKKLESTKPCENGSLNTTVKENNKTEPVEKTLATSTKIPISSQTSTKSSSSTNSCNILKSIELVESSKRKSPKTSSLVGTKSYKEVVQGFSSTETSDTPTSNNLDKIECQTTPTIIENTEQATSQSLEPVKESPQTETDIIRNESEITECQTTSEEIENTEQATPESLEPVHESPPTETEVIKNESVIPECQITSTVIESTEQVTPESLEPVQETPQTEAQIIENESVITECQTTSAVIENSEQITPESLEPVQEAPATEIEIIRDESVITEYQTTPAVIEYIEQITPETLEPVQEAPSTEIEIVSDEPVVNECQTTPAVIENIEQITPETLEPVQEALSTEIEIVRNEFVITEEPTELIVSSVESENNKHSSEGTSEESFTVSNYSNGETVNSETVSEENNTEITAESEGKCKTLSEDLQSNENNTTEESSSVIENSVPLEKVNGYNSDTEIIKNLSESTEIEQSVILSEKQTDISTQFVDKQNGQEETEINLNRSEFIENSVQVSEFTPTSETNEEINIECQELPVQHSDKTKPDLSESITQIDEDLNTINLNSELSNVQEPPREDIKFEDQVNNTHLPEVNQENISTSINSNNGTESLNGDVDKLESKEDFVQELEPEAIQNSVVSSSENSNGLESPEDTKFESVSNIVGDTAYLSELNQENIPTSINSDNCTELLNGEHLEISQEEPKDKSNSVEDLIQELEPETIQNSVISSSENLNLEGPAEVTKFETVPNIEAQVSSAPEENEEYTPITDNSEIISEPLEPKETLCKTNSVKDLIEELEPEIIEDEIKQEKKPTILTTELAPVSTSTEYKINKLVSLDQYTMSLPQVRVLTLNDKEHQISTLYRVELGWIVQFRLGPSLLGRRVSLHCNFPKKINGKLEPFERKEYQELKWCQDEGCKNSDDTALYAQISAELAGGFHYYFTYEESNEHQGSGYFLVDPKLTVGKNEELPLDCIQCQTVLAKNLGSFSTWENKLRVAKESGYNMVHFTPIQKLGASNSCYSLSEQLQLNPVFVKENGVMPKFDEVQKLTDKMRNEWKMTSICDIVLNHTANESEWLVEHPEVTYNCLNCKYMRPSYLLDSAFHTFSMDVKKGVYETQGIPPEVSTEDHLNAIRYHFHTSVLQPLKIHELLICDVNKIVQEFLGLARKVQPVAESVGAGEELKLIQDPDYRRLATTIDMDLALKLYNVYRSDCFDEDTRIKRCAEELKNKLDGLNGRIIDEINGHLNAAVENTIAGIRYFRVQHDGPKVREITIKNPLVYRYFTDHGTPETLKEHEELMYSPEGRYLMAHNGWVMNADPLKNFAAPDSNIYIRRELIAWGDSVKLRFGDKPEDCPYLWKHMREYVECTARIFDGIRLDNCHSTPIPVAEYLLDCARRVRPNLYVVAELFTNSDMTDNIFVNRLGITSLIREAMSAGDSHEEGRLVYRYGGLPVGSFLQPRVRPLVPTVAHALFLDLTHDNPSPVEKRSVFDLLPSTALVNMASCASGSNRGYDELVPHHIHVVDETREYTEWTDDEKLALGNAKFVTKKTGIIAAKRVMNDLHYKLGKEGFNQVYVDQMDADIVAVTRHCPETHESYILIAFTAFGHPAEYSENHQRGIKPLRVEGDLVEIVVEATLNHIGVRSGKSKYAGHGNYVKDTKWINGLSEYQVSLKEHIQVDESDVFERVDSGTANVTQLNFKNFKPGSIAVVRVKLPEAMDAAVKSVRKLMREFAVNKESELTKIIGKLNLCDLNRVLYRCDQEENDEFNHLHTYNIPGFGSLVYSGLQGFMSVMANIRPSNDLGHPMCGNLRDGNWMIDYIWQRLKLDPGTKELGQWLEENTKCFNSMPRYLVPCYFDVILTGLYALILNQSYRLMSDFVENGSSFVKALALGSVQLTGFVKSAKLPNLSPKLKPPKPPTRTNDRGEDEESCVTLSAGLPHFSTGYMRNWGRDTFISLRGILLLTGRYEEARQTILGYAACLRHGLIPNLLFGGAQSRYNCRDAVWWWMHCIKEYCTEVPNGCDILNDVVSRLFPTDDSPPLPAGTVDQPLHEVIQEALTIHFQGLAFRERNAGGSIDAHMTDKGFNNQIGIHPETGFVFGGNEWNCGTWMDKMGSSDKAGNRGKPATPRDGSAVELVGLSYSVTSWLATLYEKQQYPHSGVTRTHKNGTTTTWTFKEWSEKIKANFEKYFWISGSPAKDEIRPDLINKRGIYKDSHGASQDWADFQLRCNFPITMVVAPELFNAQHAWTALQQAEKYLLGPLGMRTLDPEDWAYNGNYDNSNDSDDFKVAHGLNYHQGPEWVWPVGFFLRAKLRFAADNGALIETLSKVKVVLSRHFVELQTSPWRGLPELTNKDGAYCEGSCRTQAWSMACILEVLNDLQLIESKLINSN
ncbi:glycogen debranching enzyme isoform X4 [Aethina tumida]|uniref:glycogen debranching enzyme isoform X4 n=1 Tax=Aethina tumida TaxID=116153 RepID=UPI002148A815|nr:glycogen debranching enzyme isoform X4 [Aethina tumida]